MLIFEAIVIGLAIPVAITIEHEPHAAAGVAGGVLAAVAVLLAAVVGRPGQGWTLAAGSLLQVAVIAAGAGGPRDVRARRDFRRPVGRRDLARAPVPRGLLTLTGPWPRSGLA